jgi:uncharacterized protein YvpB
MRYRAALGLLALIVVACGATTSRVAIVTSQRPAAESQAPSPEVSPSPSARPTARVLDIKIHFQEHNLTCEAAALKMALSYEGISVDELTLIGYMTSDSRPARFDSKGNLVTWGNPARGFVGNPDGNIQRYTGYGVYFGPVATAAERSGAHVVAAGGGLYGSAVAPADVYNAVLDGHPVVAWISNTYRTVPLKSYLAYDGATVSYTLTEHAVSVIGVRPDAVLVNDPWFGQHWHPKAQFEAAYRTFDNMAVIVSA